MTDDDCIQLLQWALPRLQLRWSGFRKVRRQVCRRLDRRLHALGLPDGAAYRSFLEAHRGEWATLDAASRVTISRFYRDRRVFELLGHELLPSLTESVAGRRKPTSIRCWSAGCASGEEPYTVAILWRLRVRPVSPGRPLRILATDADCHLLARARRAHYPASSLRDVPREWVGLAFEKAGPGYRLKETFRRAVHFWQQDIRHQQPDGRFHLILCRNLVFTYFDDALQRWVLEKLVERLEPGGVLVIGSQETLPGPLMKPLYPSNPGLPVYRRPPH